MNHSPASRPEPHPFPQLLLLLGLGLLGVVLASVLGLGLAMGLYGLGLDQLAQLGTSPARVPHGWAATMLTQGLTLAGLGLAAALVPVVLVRPWAGYFAPRRLGAAWWPLAAAGVLLLLLPALALTVSWNANLHLPGWAQGFEAWARAKEQELAGLMQFLTRFGGIGDLLVAVLVIGLVPAVAEELFFRGVLQRNLVRWTRSRAAGVWLAAAIFSAVHMQFLGFVPRLLLGALLGYLFEWSGNIAVPIVVHFVNNALQVVLLYFVQHGRLPAALDPDSTAPTPWPLALASLALGGAALWALRRQLQAGGPPPPPTFARL